MAEKPIDVISRVTGLKKADMDEIFVEVKANQARLDACPRHEFTIALDRRTKAVLPKPELFCGWRCAKCDGKVDGQAKRWYERGLAHAKV